MIYDIIIITLIIQCSGVGAAGLTLSLLEWKGKLGVEKGGGGTDYLLVVCLYSMSMFSYMHVFCFVTHFHQ